LCVFFKMALAKTMTQITDLIWLSVAGYVELFLKFAPRVLGGYEGATFEDICAWEMGISSSHFFSSLHRPLCEEKLKRKYDAITLVIFTCLGMVFVHQIPTIIRFINSLRPVPQKSKLELLMDRAIKDRTNSKRQLTIHKNNLKTTTMATITSAAFSSSMSPANKIKAIQEALVLMENTMNSYNEQSSAADAKVAFATKLLKNGATDIPDMPEMPESPQLRIEECEEEEEKPKRRKSLKASPNISPSFKIPTHINYKREESDEEEYDAKPLLRLTS